jgi:manganese transport protein
VLLATGILGATVMPHVIYLHSALTADRIGPADLAETRTLLRHQRVDVVVAMGIAGLVNLAMLVLAARLFFGEAVGEVDTLEGVTPRSTGSPGAGGPGLRRRAAGVRLRVVGRRDVRRAGRHAGLPAAADPAHAAPRDHDGARAARPRGRRRPDRALVLSQVVLSFGIPFAARAAGAADRGGRRHGGARQQAGHAGRRDRRRRHVIALNAFLLAGLVV